VTLSLLLSLLLLSLLLLSLFYLLLSLFYAVILSDAVILSAAKNHRICFSEGSAATRLPSLLCYNIYFISSNPIDMLSF